MNHLNKQIVKDSSDLEYHAEKDLFIIGESNISDLLSESKTRVVGAKKRFTHEWWHKIFCGLNRETQERLIQELQTKIVSDTEAYAKLEQFCNALYYGNVYTDYHYVDRNPHLLVVEDGINGIKTDTVVEIPFHGNRDKVYGAYLITELLSLSSSCEIPGVDEYYEEGIKARGETSSLGILMRRKQMMELLAKDLVQRIDSSVVQTEFRDHTETGLALFSEIANEYKHTDSIEPKGSKFV